MLADERGPLLVCPTVGMGNDRGAEGRGGFIQQSLQTADRFEVTDCCTASGGSLASRRRQRQATQDTRHRRTISVSAGNSGGAGWLADLLVTQALCPQSASLSFICDVKLRL